MREHVHTRVSMYVCACVHAYYACAHVCMGVHVCIWHACTSVHIPMCVCTRVQVCAHVCTCLHVYAPLGEPGAPRSPAQRRVPELMSFPACPHSQPACLGSELPATPRGASQRRVPREPASPGTRNQHLLGPSKASYQWSTSTLD